MALKSVRVGLNLPRQVIGRLADEAQRVNWIEVWVS